MVFKVVKIAGKGMGMVAKVKVKPGELVVKEEPFLSLGLDESGDLRGKYDAKTGEFRSPQLESELLQLSDQELRVFYSLSDAFSSMKMPSITKSNFGIIKTNSFSVTKDEETRLVLFPTIARINHSCVPNCHHYWSNKQGCFMIRAVKDIEPDQEICISYMSPLQRADFHDTESRRDILQTEFGFRCLCEICEDKEDQLDVDEKRRRILEIEGEWSELGVNPSVAMSMGEEQYRLCAELDFQAGLLAYVALHCVEAASLMVAKKKSGMEAEQFREKGVAYAEKACQFGKKAYGEESDEYEIFVMVQKICETASNLELLSEVQKAITMLRDIDS